MTLVGARTLREAKQVAAREGIDVWRMLTPERLHGTVKQKVVMTDSCPDEDGRLWSWLRASDAHVTVVAWP